MRRPHYFLVLIAGHVNALQTMASLMPIDLTKIVWCPKPTKSLLSWLMTSVELNGVKK